MKLNRLSLRNTNSLKDYSSQVFEMYSKNPCSYQDDYVDPCSLCPESETPAVVTLTTDTLTTGTIDSTIALITNLDVQDASIDITETEVLTIDGLVSNPDTYVSTMSETIDFEQTGPGLLLGLTTSPIGTLPGFTAGTMVLTGQTGFLDITVETADVGLLLPFVLTVDNSGIQFSEEISTVSSLTSFRIPIRSTDAFVTISVAGVGALEVVDYEIQLVSF